MKISMKEEMRMMMSELTPGFKEVCMSKEAYKHHNLIVLEKSHNRSAQLQGDWTSG